MNIHFILKTIHYSLKEGEDQKEITIEPAQALDEVEPLPEDCYTRPISLPEGKSLFNTKHYYHLIMMIFAGSSIIEVLLPPLSDHPAPAASAA